MPVKLKLGVLFVTRSGNHGRVCGIVRRDNKVVGVFVRLFSSERTRFIPAKSDQ